MVARKRQSLNKKVPIACVPYVTGAGATSVRVTGLVARHQKRLNCMVFLIINMFFMLFFLSGGKMILHDITVANPYSFAAQWLHHDGKVSEWIVNKVQQVRTFSLIFFVSQDTGRLRFV